MSLVEKAGSSNILELDVPEDSPLSPMNNSSNGFVDVLSVPRVVNGSEAESSESKRDAAASTPLIFLEGGQQSSNLVPCQV